MNNDIQNHRSDSDAELYSGPFAIAFALSVLTVAAAILWFF
jgi:hypothetical protein